MPTQTIPAQIGESAIVGASKGVALSTTSAFTGLRVNSRLLELTPYGFSTAVVARFNLCPWITIGKNTDGLATEPIYTSTILQDGDNTATMSMNSWPTLANGGALYIGAHVPFGGLFVDVQNTNSNASVLAVSYYNGGLTSLTATDNTASGGVAMAQDGTITWTTPTDWVAETFPNIFGPNFDAHRVIYKDQLFWVRLSWSVAFDSSVSINQMFALNRRSTASTPVYEEIPPGQFKSMSIKTSYNGVAGVEALTDAGTATMIHKVSTLGHGRFAAISTVSL